MNRFRSRMGAMLREVAVYLHYARQQSSGPLALFLPSQGRDDGAANLRAYMLAEHLRHHGWRTVVCPKHLGLAARLRLIRWLRPDIGIMQTARHPLNRPHLFSGLAVVIDLDDADYVDPDTAQPLVQALQGSIGAIAGSRAVAAFCRQHAAPVEVIWTGTPPSVDDAPTQASRNRIVTWAASSPLGSPQEASFLRQVLAILKQRQIDFQFRMYSDDGSDAFRKLVDYIVPEGISVEALPYMKYDDFLRSLDEVAIGLAPLNDISGFSGGKSFGKVLAYMERQVPVITHPVVDHPLFFRHGENGFMLKSSEEWAEKISDLLDDAERRHAIADVARKDLTRRLSTATAARLSDRYLRQRLAAIKRP